MITALLLAAQLGCAPPDEEKPSDGEDTSPTPCDAWPFLPDTDGDGFGDDAGEPNYACTRPEGYAFEGGDCDDADPAVNPGAAERCDRDGDEDCDGAEDEDGAADCTERWLDEDGDGYGGEGRCMCPLPEDTGTGDGFGAYTATVGGDCDDDDPLRAQDCSLPPFEDPAEALARLVCDRAEGCDSVEAVGDVDGDGIPDVAWYAGDGGVAIVTPVPVTGDAGVSATALGAAEPTTHVAGLGDLDGSGGDDLVTAFADCEVSDDGSTSSCELSVRAWLGGELGAPAATFLGPGYGGIGISHGAALVGDIDADGREDLLAWNGVNWQPGQVWWPPLGDGGEISTGDLTPLIEDTHLGVHGPGDLDGDGFDDLVVHTFARGAVVFDGPVPATIVPADGRVALSGDFDRLEWVPAGDLDGDGYAELVAMEPDAVYVLAGPLTTGRMSDLAVAAIASTGSANQFTAADASGDADGDGLADLVFGVRNSDAYADAGGLVGLVHGPLVGSYAQLDADVLWAGNTDSQQIGGDTRFVPDVDGDGGDELLVRALWDGGAGVVTIAYVIPGR